MEKKVLRIALIGYGRMGKMIHSIAEQRGHKVVLMLDSDTDPQWDSPRWADVDVAIEFTAPHVAFANCKRLLDKGVAVVSGTTGWAKELECLKEQLEAASFGALLWASNFSIGVNLFFEINKRVGAIMERVSDYKPSLTEIHHIHKLDAPSGTAITLAEGLIASMPSRLENWTLVEEGTQTSADKSLEVRAIRQGEVPGTHTIEYRSQVDRIELTHEAFGRQGFAEGAVVAAEYLVGRVGYYSMEDLLTYFLDNQ